VDSILSYFAGRNIRGIHSLGDGSVGIVETEIEKDSCMVEKSIKDFKLSQGGLIMLVNREKISFTLQGGYVFKAEDKIIIIAKNGSDVELEKFFGKTK